MALNNLCILRVAAVVALKKSNDHVARWDWAGGSSGDSLPIDSTTGVINMSSPLLIEHWDLVGQIHKISAAVNTAMLLASFSPTQRTTELALKVSCVTLLAAAAMSHRLLALWHPESARKCVLSATEVVSVSTSFSGDDYAYLDPTLMVRVFSLVMLMILMWKIRFAGMRLLTFFNKDFKARRRPWSVPHLITNLQYFRSVG